MVSKCLILDAIALKKWYSFSLKTETIYCREKQVLAWTKWFCCFMNLHSLSMQLHAHGNVFEILTLVSIPSQPSLLHPHQSASPRSMWAHVRVGRSATLTGLWSQPAVCVCQRADVTGGNEGWTLGLESQPSPSLQKRNVKLFLSSTHITEMNRNRSGCKTSGL